MHRSSLMPGDFVAAADSHASRFGRGMSLCARTWPVRAPPGKQHTSLSIHGWKAQT